METSYCMTPPTSRSLCIAVLTLNEARHIEACLQSAGFADQLLVIDSGSSDETCTIAQRMGAEVQVHADWLGFGEQRNRALTHCRCDTIFFLDADERISPALQAEIETAVRSDDDAVWEVIWLEVAFGHALTAMRNTRGVARMFRRVSIERFEGSVHERPVMQGQRRPPVRRFQTRLEHHSRETVHASLRKLTQYAMLGAAKREGLGQRGGIWRGLASATAIFWRVYVRGRGFMCGGPGFLFCYLLAQECFFRYVALKYDAGQLSERVRR